MDLSWDPYLLWTSFAVTSVLNIVFFLIAYTFQTDVLTDLTGSISYIAIALYTFFLQDTYTERQWIATFLLVGARVYLGGFLFYRASQRSGDSRFDNIRDKFCKFMIFWIFQILWTYITSLPLIYINAEVSNSLQTGDFIAMTCFVIGMLFEIIGDLQKNSFKSNGGKGVFTGGLWVFTRHPNYFGEMLMFWSLFGFSVVQHMQLDDKFWWIIVNILSPVFTMIILLFGSGMPTAEGSALKRFEKRGLLEDWNEYARNTPPIIPLSCCYGSLPGAIKWLCCCEFGMYKWKPRNEESMPEVPKQTVEHAGDEEN